MLKTVVFGAALALSALGATSVQAVTTVPVILDEGAGIFGKTVKTTFSYNFTFMLTEAGTLDASLTSAAVTGPINFSHVTLNGTPLLKDTSSNTYTLSSAIPGIIGNNVFHVDGVGSGKATSFVGSLQFTSLVPEPAAWGMMVIGFGALGATMRRRPAAGITANA